MSNPDQFASSFLSESIDSITTYQTAMNVAQAVLIHHFASQPQPYSGKSPLELASSLALLETFPATGKAPEGHSQGNGRVHCSSLRCGFPAYLYCPFTLPTFDSSPGSRGTD
ncbi:hypothetical protein K9N68_09520 [Kovacikia minuta CCNUW1]|uniref:hypothetical protein n=1 Tax=Kovacikia minuta TaxID=2931930 RepID=UPI001CCB1962|nr:hypothetical protein [Kovacikia minuta]UBF28096.1 hypothetical protein K9N68_09520 [Kovacikia minuta CCNUW1]